MRRFRLAGRAALSAVLVLLSAGCTSPKVMPFRDEEAFGDFALAALSAVHPDYDSGPGADVRETDDGLAATVTAYPVGSFMDRGEYFTVTVSLNQKTGQISVSPIPKTRLGRILRQLGPPADPEHAENARELLSNMGRSVEVVAVAELTEPMTDAELEKAKVPGTSKPILSVAEGPPPLGPPLFCVRPCNAVPGDLSATDSVKAWVATLGPADRPALQAFDLDLDSLRAVARRGKVFGLIYDDYPAEALLKVSEHPKVKALYVADVGLRCAGDDEGFCIPWRD